MQVSLLLLAMSTVLLASASARMTASAKVRARMNWLRRFRRSDNPDNGFLDPRAARAGGLNGFNVRSSTGATISISSIQNPETWPESEALLSGKGALVRGDDQSPYAMIDLQSSALVGGVIICGRTDWGNDKPYESQVWASDVDVRATGQLDAPPPVDQMKDKLSQSDTTLTMEKDGKECQTFLFINQKTARYVLIKSQPMPGAAVSFRVGVIVDPVWDAASPVSIGCSLQARDGMANANSGSDFEVLCPRGDVCAAPPYRLWGNGVEANGGYTQDSSICPAVLYQFGASTPLYSVFKVKLGPIKQTFQGGNQNGITANPWDAFEYASFLLEQVQ